MQVGGLTSLLGSFGLGRIPSISTRQLVGWRQFPSSLLNSPPFKGTLGAELPWLWGPDWEEFQSFPEEGTYIFASKLAPFSWYVWFLVKIGYCGTW